MSEAWEYIPSLKYNPAHSTISLQEMSSLSMLYFDVNGLGRRLLLYHGTETYDDIRLGASLAWRRLRHSCPSEYEVQPCLDQAYVRIYSETTILVRGRNDAF
ncbi:hypothetical protein LENED_008646 [Lentinula edodes]|uniref:Uncharacterized protein n=1 Tax=Lentinula edodes TaxID=5353 RepID=A0A1Q3EHT1_LENED|nr:hypothetical protein LENED_008646 [Lentinula edodes]